MKKILKTVPKISKLGVLETIGCTVLMIIERFEEFPDSVLETIGCTVLMILCTGSMGTGV